MKRMMTGWALCLALLAAVSCETAPKRDDAGATAQTARKPTASEPGKPAADPAETASTPRVAPKPPAGAPTDAAEEAVGIQNIKKEIQALREGGKFYVGEGHAAIESLDKLDEAKRKAQSSALSELLQSIEVTVRSVATDVLQLKDGKSSEEMKIVVDFYSKPTRLRDVTTVYYDNYPSRNQVTCVVRLDKQVHRDYIEEDLTMRRRVVEGFINEAVKAAQASDLPGALRNLAEAQTQYGEMGVPFYSDFDANQKPDFAESFIHDTYAALVRSVTLAQVSPAEGKPAEFDQTGKLLTPMTVKAEYGYLGRRFPVAGVEFDVEIKTAEASKEAGTVKSGPDGLVQVPVKTIPGKGIRQATVALSWRGEPLFKAPRPTLSLSLKRIPLLVRAVTVRTDGALEFSNEMAVKVDEMMPPGQMDVHAEPMRFTSIGKGEIEEARKLGGDLLLTVALDVTTAEKSGAPLAQATGRFELCDLGDGKTCLSKRLPTFTRYGTTRRTAQEAVQTVGEKYLLDALRQQFGRHLLQRAGDAESLARQAQLDENDRGRIMAFVKDALAAQARADYALALDSLLSAQRMRQITGLEWREDADGDGQADFVPAFIERKLREVVTLISIDPLDKGSSLYSGKGEIIGGQAPSVFAKAVTGAEKVQPVRNLQLRAICVVGGANLTGKLLTDQSGEAQLKIERIDPANAKTAILVEIDRDISDEIRRPPCRIELMRVPRFAVVVSSADPAALEVPDQVKNSLAEIIRDRRYEVVGEKENPDYVLSVTFSADTKLVESMKLHKSEISATASLVRTEGDRTLFTLEPVRNRGYGTKPETAVKDGLAKALEPLYLEIKKKLAGVKL